MCDFSLHYEPGKGRDRRRRLEDQLRRLGSRDPRCAYPDCPEHNPFAFTGVLPDILCYEHRCDLEGRSSAEEHHLWGQHNSPDKAFVPGNDHRVLNDLQRDWPVRTLRNPDASPLIRIAAAIRGLLDLLYVILTGLFPLMADFLERLDQQLLIQYGDRWWDTLGLGDLT